MQLPTSKTFDKAMSKLNDGECKAIFKVMSLVSEASYRRGAQQGIVLSKHQTANKLFSDAVCLHDWRYSQPLSSSRGLVGDKLKSWDRFMLEYRDG